MPDAVILDLLWGWNAAIQRAAGGFSDLMAYDPSTARAERIDEEGDPEAPCMRLSAGRWKILCPVDPGTRKISARCKHYGQIKRPSIIIERNPQLGINSDVVSTAGPQTDWQTVEATVAVTQRGVLVVYLYVPSGVVLWDDIRSQ